MVVIARLVTHYSPLITIVEATTGFEPVVRVLQTHALPLGYVAICPEVGVL
jgi:hypothetical protein